MQTIASCCPRLTSLALAHCTQFTDRGLIAALTPMLLRPAAPDCSTAPLRRLNLSFTQVRCCPWVSLTGGLIDLWLPCLQRHQCGAVSLP